MHKREGLELRQRRETTQDENGAGGRWGKYDTFSKKYNFDSVSKDHILGMYMYEMEAYTI